jgi:hypothetical protein
MPLQPTFPCYGECRWRKPNWMLIAHRLMERYAHHNREPLMRDSEQAEREESDQ